jgi:iron complex transport system ATP-binding protein
MNLVADSVTYAYNGDPVVRGVSLTLRSGQVVGVIGPNGSGKSTLIRLLARAFSPKSGRVSLDGRDLNSYDRAALARLIAVVAQSPQLPDAFTVEELVLLGRTPHLGFLASEGPGDRQVAQRAMEITDTLRFVQRRMGQLSGGERQRVVIARALAQEPHVLLLDEPTTYLDLSHQLDILKLVVRLAREHHLAVLSTFHDLNAAAEYCDELVLLQDGRVFAQGRPQDVLTPEIIGAAFGAQVCVFPNPLTGTPIVVATHPIYNTPLVVH